MNFTPAFKKWADERVATCVNMATVKMTVCKAKCARLWEKGEHSSISQGSAISTIKKKKSWKRTLLTHI